MYLSVFQNRFGWDPSPAHPRNPKSYLYRRIGKTLSGCQMKNMAQLYFGRKKGADHVQTPSAWYRLMNRDLHYLFGYINMINE